jgi:hypothetical protein
MHPQQIQNQVNQKVMAPEKHAGEHKEFYRSSPIVSPSAEDGDPTTHTNTSDISLHQKKPLSKVPDTAIIKQLRELIDSQKIFQKDISAKLGVRYGRF